MQEPKPYLDLSVRAQALVDLAEVKEKQAAKLQSEASRHRRAAKKLKRQAREEEKQNADTWS